MSQLGILKPMMVLVDGTHVQVADTAASYEAPEAR